MGAGCLWTVAADKADHLGRVQVCLDTLMEHGTDRYGAKTTPVLVSILDVETRQCPSNPAALDEAFRVIRRERRKLAREICIIPTTHSLLIANLAHRLRRARHELRTDK